MRLSSPLNSLPTFPTVTSTLLCIQQGLNFCVLNLKELKCNILRVISSLVITRETDF